MPKDHMDQPPYDATLFEAERLARAKEFAKIVRNLARFDLRTYETDELDKWVYRGAQYELAGGKQVDAVRQGYFAKPEYSMSAVRVSGPWIEHLGIDGLRRRVRTIRDYNYSVAPDFNVPGEHDDDSEGVGYVPPYLERAIERLQKQRERENFEKSMDPDYRPPEIIEAKSGSIVEVKLQNGPNWRTERTDMVRGQAAERAHDDAKRVAGAEDGGREYSADEHEELLFLLQMIKMTRIKAGRPQEDIV